MTKTVFFILLILLAWQTQVQAQTFVIATNPSTPPFESIGKDGGPVGFDIDFLAALGFVFNGYIYEIATQSWDDVFAGVLNGTFDFAISSITINQEREEIYDFSVPYFVSTHVILAPEGTDITNAQDLLDKNVAVVTGTTGETAIEGLFGGDSPNIQHFEDLSQAVQALADGSVDAYVDDSGFLENYAKNNAGFVVIRDPETFAKEFYGLMFPKGSSLVDYFDDGITTLLENGEYSEIYATWFDSTPDLDLLLAAGEDENPYEALDEEEGEYFISDLETTTESRFVQEVASWTSSVPSTPKYYICASDPVLGGYNWCPSQGQTGQYLSRQYTSLPPHTIVKYSFSFWAIDSWDWSSSGGGDRDKFQIQFDNLPVIEGYGITWQPGPTNICGNSPADLGGIKVTGWAAHTALSLSIKFITTFNDGSHDESFGVRDLVLIFANDNPGADYICAYTPSPVGLRHQATCPCATGKYSSSSGCASCSQECASCYGLGADKCVKCAESYYFDGSKCSKCDSSCSKCTGPGFNQCTECRLSGFALFNGVCISASRCISSPFAIDSGPVECYSNCPLSSFATWIESCYPPCPSSSISDLNGICKTCKYLSAQYLRATDDGHQYTFQLSPSSCDLTIENVRRYLSLTEHTPNSVGSFSFQVTKTSANNYFISLVLDQSVLEETSLDLKLSYLSASLDVPKKFVLDGTLKAIAAAVPTVSTGFTGVLGGSFVSTLALGATAGLWSIVSFQQFVGYFLFINVEYPPVVELFLSMLQVSIWDILPNPLAALTDSLSADLIAQDKMAVTPYDPPNKFVKYEINSFFIENGGVIIAVNIALLAILGQVLLLKMVKAWRKNPILVKLKVWIKWNLIARTFLENGIPLSLAVFLQLRIATFNHSYLILCFVGAMISLLNICAFVIFFWRVLLQRSNEHLKKGMVRRMYGTLYEGIVLGRPFSKYYNVVILTRGILLMALITFFEASPIVQIFPLILFNAVLVLYMFKQVTFGDKKLDFIVKLKEILVLCGEMGMLFLCFKVDSENYYQILGYLIVSSLGVALVAEVGYMMILQICEIKNLWKKIKSGWNWVIRWKNKGNKIEKMKMKPSHRFQDRDLSQSSSELIITHIP